MKEAWNDWEEAPFHGGVQEAGGAGRAARIGALSRAERLAMVERGGELSLARQCGLLGIGQASPYHEPAHESEANLALMRRLDELCMECPFYGSRQMVRHLRRGTVAGRHGVRRLMGLGPVPIIEYIHSRTLPTRRESGIHSGTENADGIM